MDFNKLKFNNFLWVILFAILVNFDLRCSAIMAEFNPSQIDNDQETYEFSSTTSCREILGFVVDDTKTERDEKLNYSMSKPLARAGSNTLPGVEVLSDTFPESESPSNKLPEIESLPSYFESASLYDAVFRSFFEQEEKLPIFNTTISNSSAKKPKIRIKLTRKNIKPLLNMEREQKNDRVRKWIKSYSNSNSPIPKNKKFL